MKDWVTEISNRMKNADNACAVLELCNHELRKGIDEDIKTLEYIDYDDLCKSGQNELKARQELVAELEDLLRVCNEYGESCQANWEENMERSISRYERRK